MAHSHMVFTVQVAPHETENPAWRIGHAGETISLVYAYFMTDASGEPVRSNDGTFEVHAPSWSTLDTLRQMLEEHEGLTIVGEREEPGNGLVVIR